MLPSLSIDRQTIARGAVSTVGVLLDVVAPPAAVRAGPPLDIVVVLDPRPTAGADPLAAAATATSELLRVARPDDRIGVVAVDRDAVVVLPLGHHDPELASRAIRSWQTASAGIAASGRAIAADLLAAAQRAGAEQRLVVLTDDGPAARVAHLFGTGPVAHDLAVTVVGSPAVSRIELLDPVPGIGPSGDHVEGVVVELGDTYGGEVRRVALALTVRPPESVGVLDLARVDVRWVGPGPDRASYTIELPVAVRVHVLGNMGS